MVDDVGFVMGTYLKGGVIIALMYDMMYMISTVITIYAIKKIYDIILKLQVDQSSLGINKKMIAIHILMLVFITILSISQSLVIVFFSDNQYLGTSVYIWCDIFLQSTICYICWTLGCSAEVSR